VPAGGNFVGAQIFEVDYLYGHTVDVIYQTGGRRL